MGKGNILLREEKNPEGARMLEISDSDGKKLGSAVFYTPDGKGFVTFKPDLQQGSAAKCIDAICSWAEEQPGWTKLRIYTSDDEKELNRAIKKQGFLSSVDSSGELCWDKRLEDGNYIFVLAVIGLLVGCVAGGLLGYFSYGLIGGVVLGLGIGVALWWKDRKKKKK